MSRPPAMPLHCAKFLAETDHLGNEEQWAYLKLLMKMWVRNGRAFPDNDNDLARIVNMPLHRWMKIRARIAEFFDLSGGVWQHAGLDAAVRRVASHAHTSRRNGMQHTGPVLHYINAVANPAGIPLGTQRVSQQVPSGYPTGTGQLPGEQPSQHGHDGNQVKINGIANPAGIPAGPLRGTKAADASAIAAPHTAVLRCDTRARAVTVPTLFDTSELELERERVWPIPSPKENLPSVGKRKAPLPSHTVSARPKLASRWPAAEGVWPRGRTVPEDWRMMARTMRPEIDADLEADKFADNWIAENRPIGMKRDWLATWRNWIRNSKSSSRENGKATGNGTELGYGQREDDLTWRSLLATFVTQRVWYLGHGPAPGDPYCEVPHRLLIEFGLARPVSDAERGPASPKSPAAPSGGPPMG